jgi:hypothetical protein
MINKPYRDIAGAADVALETIGWLVWDLKEMGFFIEIGTRNRKLMNMEHLLKRRVEAYGGKQRNVCFNIQGDFYRDESYECIVEHFNALLKGLDEQF